MWCFTEWNHSGEQLSKYAAVTLFSFLHFWGSSVPFPTEESIHSLDYNLFSVTPVSIPVKCITQHRITLHTQNCSPARGQYSQQHVTRTIGITIIMWPTEVWKVSSKSTSKNMEQMHLPLDLCHRSFCSMQNVQAGLIAACWSCILQLQNSSLDCLRLKYLC